MLFDNNKPLDYPELKPADFLGEQDILVKEGDFIVNRDGSLMEVTHGNYKYSISDKIYDREINIHYIRAKYLGNRDDSLECANQIRLAKDYEIEEVKSWLNSGLKFKIAQNGQLSFI